MTISSALDVHVFKILFILVSFLYKMTLHPYLYVFWLFKLSDTKTRWHHPFKIIEKLCSYWIVACELGVFKMLFVLVFL